MTPTYPEVQYTVFESARLEDSEVWMDSNKVPVRGETLIDGEKVASIVLVRKDLLAGKGTSPIDEARPLITKAIEEWIAEHP